MSPKPGLDGSVTEGPISVVEEQLVGSRLVHLGMAVLAMPVTFAQRLVIDVPLQIIDDHQVEESVVVHVDPGPGDGPEWTILRIELVQPGLRRDVGECSISIIVIKRVAVYTGYKNVFVTIVVIISDGNAGVVTSSSQASFLGDVGEMPVPVVLEEPVGIFRG